MKIKYIFFAVALTLCLANFNVVKAQDVPATIKVTAPPSTIKATAPAGTPAVPAPTYPYLQNPLKAKSVEEIVVTVVDLAIVIGVIFAVFMFIWIGFKFVMARGNDSALKEAKEWFMYAVIGTAILISAKVIVEVVKNTFISAGVVKQELFNKKI